ncbi:hypothetical protein LTR17_023709 [Elasticomyces elasticus]|nr:hypothetical protein LTR17_023709 [Elasticomyces elasticus]
MALNVLGNEVHAHKLFLAWQSKYFETAFFGPFSEASAKVVELHEDEPCAMQGLIALLYGEASQTSAWFKEYQLSIHEGWDVDAYGEGVESKYMLYLIELYIAASKYLVELALGKIMSIFEDALSTQSFRWPTLIEHIYSIHAEAARAFRAQMVAYCAASSDDLRILTGGSAARESLLEFPEFSVDLLAAMVEVRGMKRSTGPGVRKDELKA